MPPQPTLLRSHYVSALSVRACVCPGICHVPSVFLSLRHNTERITTNLQEVTTTTNRLNDYIVGEIETETREEDTTECSNRRQSVLSRRQTGADA